MPLVLVVEDEPHVRALLRTTLGDRGFRVIEAENGAQGLAMAAQSPDIVLLDLGLPDIDGVALTERLREWLTAPILVISARGREDDKVAALDAGANDYVTKPFGMGELLARMRVWLRDRTDDGASADASILEVGSLRIDRARRVTYVDGVEVHLTPTEYKLLSILMKNAGRVMTHPQILKTVWGESAAGETQYLRVYMKQLRHKLEVDPARPRYLLTEPGVGYRLKSV